MVCPDTRSKHVTRYHKSSRSPATRRVYASLFRAPQWHGATQTHSPPRPRKSQWHCNTRYHISPRSPVTRRVYASCFALHSGTAPRKRTFHQGCANPNGTATSRTSRRRAVCPHTRSSHASVSYETSSKSHASRLQDGVSYETSSKSQAETPIGAQPCQAVSRFQPLQTTPAHTPIPM